MSLCSGHTTYLSCLTVWAVFHSVLKYLNFLVIEMHSHNTCICFFIHSSVTPHLHSCDSVSKTPVMVLFPCCFHIIILTAMDMQISVVLAWRIFMGSTATILRITPSFFPSPYILFHRFQLTLKKIKTRCIKKQIIVI